MRASEPVARRGTHKKSLHQERDTPDTNSTSSPPKVHPLMESLLGLKPQTMTPYVLQGMYYFLRHSLWKAFLWPIFWAIVFAIATFCILFPIAFVPQAIALSTVMTPFLGWPLAFLLTLIQMLLVILIFSAVVLLPITDKLFDQTLVLRGHGDLVAADNGMACCGCCSIVSILNLLVCIITLPLNLIPLVGTVLWLFLNGRLYTWDKFSHYHYELKRRNFRTQQQIVRNHWYAYHMFGMQAMALEMIPFANVIFIFTNTVGVALWAADLEDRLLQHDNNNNNNNVEYDHAGKTTTNNKTSYPTEETTLTLPVPHEKATVGYSA
jgi:Etoposide-induced protein 2.4 (EI24)